MSEIEDKICLMKALHDWKKWQAAGCPKYETSYIHDNYHNYIDQKEDGTYEFNIQTYDSPDGDTWWKGRFKIIGGIDVEIIESTQEHR